MELIVLELVLLLVQLDPMQTVSIIDVMLANSHV